VCRYRGDDTDAMNGNAVYYDLNKVFTVGGALNYDNGLASNRAYIIDMSGSEPVVERQGNMMFDRAHCNSVVLPNGHILVIGGQSRVVLFQDTEGVLNMELFVPEEKKFYELRQPIKYARNYHATALLMKDGRVFIGGGGLCTVGCDFTAAPVRTILIENVWSF
jgi:galactose oxidase